MRNFTQEDNSYKFMGTKIRKEQEKENRRQVILDAAEYIMQLNGVYGLNIDMIATETQLAKGTIYLYFKSKEEIIAALSLKGRVLLLRAIQQEVNRHELPIEKLKAIVYAAYNFYKENSLLNDLVSLYEANSQLVETAELQNASDNITKLVVEIAQKAKEDGSLKSTINPLHFTFCMWGMTVGMTQLMKVRGKIFEETLNISEQDLLNSYVQILENGMRT